jgi:hypothetical protein
LAIFLAEKRKSQVSENDAFVFNVFLPNDNVEILFAIIGQS